MFSGFENFFQGIIEGSMPGVFQNPHQQNQAPNTKLPPASKRAIDSLPIVTVTADDLIEATNKECLICLEEQELGSKACKLQCGHLFHKACVAEWLEKHCSCPVCRYEIETDDQTYETERKKKMENRKVRLRLDELKKKPMSQLRDLARTLKVNLNGCLEKSEVIDRLKNSNKIIFTEGLPPIELSEDEFNSKSVSELRHLLLSFDISDEGALEKRELRTRLLESGRIVLSVSDADNMKIDEENEGNQKNDDLTSTSTRKEEKYESQESVSKKPRLLAFSVQELKDMSLSELRDFCHQNEISTSGCIDKSEVVENILNSGKINVITEDRKDEKNEDKSTDSDDFVIVEDNLKNEIPTSTPMKVDENDSNPVQTHNSPVQETEKTEKSGEIEEDKKMDDFDGLVLSMEILNDMSIRELRGLMEAYNIDTSNCVEKREMFHRLKSCDNIRVLP